MCLLKVLLRRSHSVSNHLFHRIVQKKNKSIKYNIFSIGRQELEAMKVRVKKMWLCRVGQPSRRLDTLTENDATTVFESNRSLVSILRVLQLLVDL